MQGRMNMSLEQIGMKQIGSKQIGSKQIGLEQDVAVQATTLLGAKLQTQGARARLQTHDWPPVRDCDGLSHELQAFLALDAKARLDFLAELHADADAHGAFVHLSLGEIYAYLFGYRDGVATAVPDDAVEAALLGAKIGLEREFIDRWVGRIDAPAFETVASAADHLDHLAATNPGVHHPLFHYIEHEAPRAQVEMFLRGEVIRNEVVDDEVALLAFGLQGTQKAVAVANLWDECGRGRLENFHTFWLRRFIGQEPGQWDAFMTLREENPWFAKITSNTNNMLLTRPAYKQMAYGCFMMFESWVEPHFRAIMGAMDRLGDTDNDRRVYFAAHIAVDPRHSKELSDGLRMQTPALDHKRLNDVIRGAHLAVAAGVRQYDHWLRFFKQSGARASDGVQARTPVASASVMEME
jgi:hypothetical protein